MHYRLLTSLWRDTFTDILRHVQTELFVVSPFISTEGVNLLTASLPDRTRVALTLMTSLTVEHIVSSATQPAALLELYNQFGRVSISSLARLHAKVYLIDDKLGVLTSANLTHGGLIDNFEYGVLFEDRDVIAAMKDDMLRYFALGNRLDREILQSIHEESVKLYSIRQKTEEAIQHTALAQLLEKSAQRVELELLQNRIKDGRTINAIFSDTILYLLRKHGGLTTENCIPSSNPYIPIFVMTPLTGSSTASTLARNGSIWLEMHSNLSRPKACSRYLMGSGI